MLVYLSADRDGPRFLKVFFGRPWTFASFCLALALLIFTVFHRDVLEGFARNSFGRGFWAFSQDEPVYDVFARVAGNLWHGGSALPVVGIDIRFENQRKLDQKRVAALERGLLFTEDDDYVSATLKFEGRRIPIRMRLKGDWLDHVSIDKPSYRVHVRGGDQLFGLRRFSIQHPQTRGFQAEALFHEMLRHYGVLAPRYLFVEFHQNGNDLGIMALEEHFSKELLESQGRRESVILKFDEDNFWKSWGEELSIEDSIADDYRTAHLASFQSGKVANSTKLTENYRAAAGLLRAFRQKKLKASEVFESQLIGRFIAVADVFGSWHSLRWHNQRFYFNPITAKLEPIGFDASLQERLVQVELYRIRGDMVTELLGDREIFHHYKSTLQDILRRLESGELALKLRELDRKLHSELSREYYFLSHFPLNDLITRAEYLVRNSRYGYHVGEFKGSSLDAESASRKASNWLNAYMVRDGEKSFLEVIPTVGFEVELEDAYWTIDNGTGLSSRPAISKNMLPLQLPPREFYGKPEGITLPLLDSEPNSNARLNVVVRRKTDGREKTIRAISHVFARTEPIVPISTLATQLARHDFLEYRNGRLYVRPGNWEVTSDIIVPKGVTLEISPETILSFANDAALISHGAVNFAGQQGREVILKQSGDDDAATWPGLVVLQAPEASRLSNVLIHNTRGIDRDGWSLTGGATFYRSDVLMEFSRFRNHRGEDALNIVSSTFDLREVTIANTLSDAFDSDFSEGYVASSRFERIGTAGGGDAIDVSGSKIDIVDSVFQDVSDKAISVGEGSSARVSRSSMSRVGTGLASKDGSTLKATGVTIHDPLLAGAMAYIKKPEYGPARIEVTNIVVSGDVPIALAQTGSEILLNEQRVSTQALDVEKLYQTAMKPGLRK